MARQRDYAAEYAARQARARAAGYGSYYEQRVAGATTSNERQVAAGHRGPAALRRALAEGDLVSVVSVDRKADGTYTRILVSVIDANGGEREYTLRGSSLRPAAIRGLSQDVDDAGAVQSPGYPLRRFYEHDDELDVELDDEVA